MSKKWDGIFKKWCDFLRNDAIKPEGVEEMSLGEKSDILWFYLEEFRREHGYAKRTINTMANIVAFVDTFYRWLDGEKYPEWFWV